MVRGFFDNSFTASGAKESAIWNLQSAMCVLRFKHAPPATTHVTPIPPSGTSGACAGRCPAGGSERIAFDRLIYLEESPPGGPRRGGKAEARRAASVQESSPSRRAREKDMRQKRSGPERPRRGAGTKGGTGEANGLWMEKGW